MDEKSYLYLHPLSATERNRIIAIPLSRLIEKYPNLAKIKKERSIVEFYFTCSPFICSYVFQDNINCLELTYLDADLFFFSSPEIIFSEIANASVAIIEHKFYGWGKKYLKYGKFNVGWLTFNGDIVGRACLEKWRSDCEEWCCDYFDKKNNRFGDQKYLDEWQKDFSGVKVITHKGANLAPWNVGQYNIKLGEKNCVLIDGESLVFYHFASFKKVKENVFTTSLSRYMSRPNKILKTYIYGSYLKTLHEQNKNIAQFFNSTEIELLKKNRQLISKSSLGLRLSFFLSSILRWYFNDYIQDTE